MIALEAMRWLTVAIDFSYRARVFAALTSCRYATILSRGSIFLLSFKPRVRIHHVFRVAFVIIQ